MPQLKPIVEASSTANISRRTIERWIRAGELKSFKRPGDRQTYVDVNAVRSAASQSLQRGLYLRCYCYLPAAHSQLRDKLVWAVGSAIPAAKPRSLEAVSTTGARHVHEVGFGWTIPFPHASTLHGATRDAAEDIRELAARLPEYKAAGRPPLRVQAHLLRA